MQYQALLQRSWQIFKTNRTLWWLAFILALVSQGGGNVDTRWIGNMPGEFGESGNAFPGVVPEWFPALLLALFCFAFLIVVLFALVRYVTRVGFIQTVVHAEAGQSIMLRDALRLGWSRHAWRLFLIDFVVGMLVFVIFILFFLIPFCALIFVLLFSIEEGVDALSGAMLFLFGIVFLVGIAALLVVSFVVSMVTNLASRAVVIDNLGVVESLSDVWALIRTHPTPVVVVSLIAFGIQILSGVVKLVALFMGIPLFIGGMALWLATSSWGLVVLFAIVGLLVLWLAFGIVSAPFVGYLETYWTLAYQDLRRLLASPEAPLDA